MTEPIKDIFEGILNGQSPIVQQKVWTALEVGIDPGVILRQGMIAAMAQVGSLFEAGEYYIPEMLVAARAMQAGLVILKPHLQQAGLKSSGTVVIGTVKGDLHDIGKNLVAMMLEGAGFDIIDLGTDVSAEEFVAAARENQADLLAISALLTTTMLNMKGVVEALDSAGLHQQVKVIVGGAPVTDEYAHQIGADGFATDASRAVTVARLLV